MDAAAMGARFSAMPLSYMSAAEIMDVARNFRKRKILATSFIAT